MKWLFSVLFALSFCTCQPTIYKTIAPPFEPSYALNRFESTIRDYEKQDSVQMPEAGKIVFAGSSSFYFWKNAQSDLAPLPVINRGFGGSTLPEVIYYADRSILKYKPKTVVIYCENDLFDSKTKTPAQVRDAYVTLVKKLRQSLPNVELYFVSIKPSPLRWSRWSEASEVNALIKAFIQTDKHHHYVDVTATMLRNGRPDANIYLKDSLHMNAEGYRRWTAIFKPILAKSPH
jgi:lysophospholipase L1-like esterase